MRLFTKYPLALLTIAFACQAGLVLAAGYRFQPNGEPVPTPRGTATVQQQAPPAYSEGETAAASAEAGDSTDPWYSRLGCDNLCERLGVVAFAGFDSFQGVSDLSSNFGVVSGLNTGVLLPGLSEYGFGWQTGLSYGVYDWDGRTAGSADLNKTSQTQLFITTGFFRKAACDQRLSFGLVYDWMLNNEWGEFKTSPTLGQWRGQIECAFGDRNAIGAWGCVRDLSAVNPALDSDVMLATRAISQVNLFWHHKFCTGADSYLWFGVPDHGRIDGDGSLIDWTAGIGAQVPVSRSLALYGSGAYFHPSAAAGWGAAMETGYNISVGLTWYIGGNLRCRSINGNCATPYMPVANNTNFLVEESPLFNVGG
jgi:hypothetical protein